MTITLPPLLALFGVLFLVIVGAAAGFVVAGILIAVGFDRWDWPWMLMYPLIIGGAAAGGYIGWSLT